MEARVAPVSLAQQRLWFMEQILPNSALFNLHTAWRITIPFTVSILERALNEIIRRHESLRTTFTGGADEQVMQIIHPALSLAMPVVNLADWPAAEREAEALRLANEEAQRPFDLERGPLIRTRLLRLGREEHVFLLTMHHLVSDGWSMGLFWNELGQIWTAFANGKPSPLPELRRQYSDYALWERERFKTDSLKQQVEYWKRQLAGLPVLDLPFAKPRPALQTFNGEHYHFELPQELLGRLQTFGQRSGATLFMTVFSVFAVLLARLSGQHDIAIGTYIAGRNEADFEPLIGFFLNTLVLRVNTSGNPTFRELLRRVRDVTLDAYANQDVPFATLVEELQPERDLSRNPLFQVLFQLLNVPTLKNVTSTRPNILRVERGTSTFDITFTLQESGGNLSGELEFNRDLFDPAAIRDLAERYSRLLDSVAEHPDQRLSQVPVLSAQERDQVVSQWNRTQVPLDCQSGPIALFERRAAERPQRVALIDGKQEISFGELNERANRLARHLRKSGARPETLVAICFERSFDSVTALLAVLKAGAAFLPLDPNYPAERLAYMAAHADVSIMLTNGSLLGLASAPQTICLDRDADIINRYDSGNLDLVTSPQQLAYAIYTSGSTGRPAGVFVEYAQILNRLDWMWKAYPFAEDDVCCHKTRLSFVDSIWEILGPLPQGIPIVLLPDRVLLDTDELIRRLAEASVTRIWVVPALLRALLESGDDLCTELPKLTFWVSSGEELTADVFERFEARMPHAVLFNLYGTSENWDVTWFDPRRRTGYLKRIPVGSPIQNMQTYILDADLEPVLTGAQGDLYVAGVGLARGYIGDAAQTAAKFISNPFSSEPSRMYATGDLARWMPDGNIEFLGRRDNQVKIRGHRVELSEIETALRQCPEVKNAAVIYRRVEQDEPALCAYVSSRNGTAAAETELRAHLRKTLPEYMMPSRIAYVDSFPLTPSGKIDRRALPAPHASTAQAALARMSMANEVEETILSAWRGVLVRNGIGLQDNFFDVGGHSLLMMRVFSQLKRRFQSLTITDLFQFPTVSGLAAHIGQSQTTKTSFSKIQERARRQKQARAAGR
jgi:amino acid adenylation domain-containing protein